MAHIIVFGNEKGGVGKSTMAMHTVLAMMYSNMRVGVIDLDVRQVSLLRFFENRAKFIADNIVSIPLPYLAPNFLAKALSRKDFEKLIADLSVNSDYIVIDCPGALTLMSRLAHMRADTLVTPINDSFVDFDLLGRMDASGTKVKSPSIYAEMVWEARKTRALTGGKAIDWIVIRNRLLVLNMHNKRKVSVALNDLSKRVGFRLLAGFSDRVIFRELFPLGLTLLDGHITKNIPVSLSNIAARQEIRDMMLGLRLPNFRLGF